MSSLSLTIRLSSGKRFTVEVPSASISIASTKSKIEEEHTKQDPNSDKLEASRQKLVFKGRILDDDSKTLGDYGVTVSGSTLFLVMGSKKKPAPPPAPPPAPVQAAAPAPASASTNAWNSAFPSTTNNTNSAAANPWASFRGATVSLAPGGVEGLGPSHRQCVRPLLAFLL